VNVRRLWLFGTVNLMLMALAGFWQEAQVWWRGGLYVV
jgi:hypothetical protein